MQISQRELTLQKIIKNQEARIMELEKLVNAPPTPNTDRQFYREKQKQLEQIVIDLRERLKEKQKENSHIKEELISMRGQIRDDKQDKKNLQLMSKERDSFFKTSTELDVKVKELEARLKSSNAASQKEIEKLQKSNQLLNKQNSNYKQHIMSVELEIEKLQIYYRSSLQQLPKRKQTLTWVGNLIKFIDKYEQFLKQHPLEKQCQYLQKPLSDLEVIVKECSEQIRANIGDRVSEMKKLKQQILGLIGDTYKKYDKILDENKIFWEEIKKQKTHKSNETQRKLDQQNKKLKEEYEIKYNDLLKQFKSVDQQKREIVLAIQQLKGYYESREKNFKDEITLLKKTQLKMIDFSQKRQHIFQEEIMRLSSEVAYLGQLYEDSVKNNIRNHHQFISNQIKAAKEIMTPTMKNELKQIISLLKQKESNLQKQMSMLSDQQLRGLQIVKNSCDTLITLQNRFVQCLELLKGDDVDEFEDNEQINIELVKFEELEDRKNYEISLVKKRNDRLQDQINRLQQKVKNESNPKDNQLVRSLRQKNKQLEDQKSLLEEMNQKFKKKFNASLKKLFKASSSGMKQLFFQNIQMVSIEIQKIQSTQYEELLPLIKSQTIRQQQYAEIIEANLKQILQLIEQPFSYLNSLMKRQNQDRVNDTSGRVIQVNVGFSSQIQQYKEILQDRVSSAPTVKISKILSDLILNIKSTLPQRDHNRSSVKEIENFSERKTVKIKTPIQQRIKDIQNNRIVDKNEMLKALQKVEYSLKKIDGGKLMMNKSTEILARIESSLNKVTREIGQMFQKSLIERQFKELTGLSKNAISDLEAKLKESVCENEGLVKQFKLISSLQAIKQLKNEKEEIQ